MKIPMSRTVQLALRMVLGVIFLWAAISKAKDVQTFIEEVVRYQILPDAIVPTFAICLIGIEVAASLLLLIGIRVRLAAGTTALMLSLFIIALVQALLRHLDLTCGCFGGEEPATWWTVGRDGILLMACLILIKESCYAQRRIRKESF